jgi:SAM-dependent methyltransferase
MPRDARPKRLTRLVRPLEPPWRATLDGLARARGWPTSSEPDRLGDRVAQLSAAYNAGARAPEQLAARLGFSFARDVPKAAGAVRELVATGALALQRGRALRVLDLGAGLGAATWGLVRALDAAGQSGRVHARLVDDEPAALALAEAIVRARGGEDAVELVVEARRGDLRAADVGAGWDVVICAQALSEVDLDAPADDRARAHAALLHALVRDALAPDGTLVVVEPALRDRTRHLHAVRDALVAAGAHVFAPCLHQAPCPALAAPSDWCHEDLPVDLPDWLVPVARRAGLRWQGLTFAYLAVNKSGDTLAGRLGARRGLRVVSGPLVSKGKRECYLCGSFGAAAVPARARVTRLDRHASPGNAAWERVERGDVLVPSAPLDPARPRISADMAIDVRTSES